MSSGPFRRRILPRGSGNFRRMDWFSFWESSGGILGLVVVGLLVGEEDDGRGELSDSEDQRHCPV